MVGYGHWANFSHFTRAQIKRGRDRINTALNTVLNSMAIATLTRGPTDSWLRPHPGTIYRVIKHHRDTLSTYYPFLYHSYNKFYAILCQIKSLAPPPGNKIHSIQDRALFVGKTSCFVKESALREIVVAFVRVLINLR